MITESNRAIELLEEILLWMKYDYLETKKKLLEILDTDEKKTAYELSDGINSGRSIAREIGVGNKTIGNWWKKWFEAGLIEQTEKYRGGQYKKLCSLTKMGIKLSEKEEGNNENE